MALCLEQSSLDMSRTEFKDDSESVFIRLRKLDAITTGIYTSHSETPAAVLRFGADHSLGSISFNGEAPVAMAQYLSRESSTARRFSASNGKGFKWTCVPKASSYECTCHPTGYRVASYSINSPTNSASLFIEKNYTNYMLDFIATLVIQVHIAKCQLRV